MRISSALAGLVCFGFLVSPVSASAAVLDLATAVERSLDRNPKIQEVRERESQTRFEKYNLRSSLLPTIGITAVASHQKDSVANRTVGAVPFSGDSYNLYNVGIRGEQSLFTYGIFAAVKAAELAREISEVALETSERDMTREVIKAYFKVVLKENQVRLLEGEQAAVSDVLRTAQNRLRLGGKRIDVLQVRTQLALVKPKIDRAKNEFTAAAAELAELMQEGTAFELSSQMPNLKVKDVEKRLDLSKFRLPELVKLRLEREQVDEARAVTLGKHLPQLKAIGSYAFANYTKAELFDPASNSWAVQLQLTVPLFSGLSSVFERRALNSRDEQLILRERDTANQLQLAQLKSRKTLESAEASLGSAEEAATLAKDSLREAQRDYRFGILDFLQFMQVQQADFEASSSLAQLRYDAIVAYADYFVASGQPIRTLVNELTQGAK